MKRSIAKLAFVAVLLPLIAMWASVQAPNGSGAALLTQDETAKISGGACGSGHIIGAGYACAVPEDNCPPVCLIACPGTWHDECPQEASYTCETGEPENCCEHWQAPCEGKAAGGYCDCIILICYRGEADPELEFDCSGNNKHKAKENC